MSNKKNKNKNFYFKNNWKIKESKIIYYKCNKINMNNKKNKMN